MAEVRDRALWLADWSDEEQQALEQAAPGIRVLRSAPLGTTVGSRRHRLRSWPAYAELAIAGRRAARPGDVLVAWQPLAGVAAVLMPGRRPPVILLNPLLAAPGSPASRSPVQSLVRAASRRADRVAVYTAVALEDAVRLGVPRDRLSLARLGATPLPGGLGAYDPNGPLLALGRDHRDLDVLAAAARAAGVEVLVAGPSAAPPPLRVVQLRDRTALAPLLRSARAVVVPLRDATRQAGTLAVLDALVAGRPVVATRGPGTVDYLPEGVGALVPPADVDALAQALRSDEATLRAWAGAATALAPQLSTAAFVRRVEQLVRDVVGDERNASRGSQTP